MFMKKTMLALVASLTLSVPLAGCAGLEALETVGTVAEVVAEANRPADEIFNTVADEKAYWAMLQFEVQANTLAGQAVDMGLLKAGSRTAIKVADLLLELEKVTSAAKLAKNANDAVTLHDKIEAGKALSDQILNLLS